jgi:hypothetical protein
MQEGSMGSKPLTRATWALAALVLAAGCAREESLTPDAARAKGEALLREMSQHVASTPAFSYRSEQAIERVRGTEKVTEHFVRYTTVRRPNQLTFSDKGDDHDTSAWYDGKQLTIVSNRDKVWVRGPMPGTLDEAMDYVSAEYAVQIPTADLLYSNPYDALITPDTTGGWVNVEQVDTRTCDHLSYQHPVVDWQIWLTQDDRRLPCQLQVTYKNEPLRPVARIVFHDWNAAPAVADATFTPAVPDGYRRIKLMRHATVVDETAAKEKE